jgi:hypothetical protein
MERRVIFEWIVKKQDVEWIHLAQDSNDYNDSCECGNEKL